jgi:hypothetical protein
MLFSVELLDGYIGKLEVMQKETVVARFDVSHVYIYIYIYLFIYLYCYFIAFFAEVHMIYVTVWELALLLILDDVH